MNLSELTAKIKEAYILVGSTIGLVVAGLAPAILFGYSLYHALVTEGWKVAPAVAAGISLAISMEVVGGVSAYVAQHARNFTVKTMAYGTLTVYTFIGLGYMAFFEPNHTIRQTGVMSYLVAPLLYLAVALLSATVQQGKEREEGKQQAVAVRRDEMIWQREQQAKQAEWEHEERLARLQLEAEVKKAKVTPPQPAATVDKVDTVVHTPKTVDDLTPAQRRIYEAIKASPEATYTEIGTKLGISRQAVSKQVKQMNGVMRS